MLMSRWRSWAASRNSSAQIRLAISSSTCWPRKMIRGRSIRWNSGSAIGMAGASAVRARRRATCSSPGTSMRVLLPLTISPRHTVSPTAPLASALCRAALAATQIGASVAVFSYNVDGHIGYLINPQIVELSGTQSGPEACLSIPGVSAERARAAHAVATGVNLRQEPVSVSGTGELARCLQHETDHLPGELYIDKLTRAERRRILPPVHPDQPPGPSPQAPRRPPPPPP